jgi:hypothetical protein
MQLVKKFAQFVLQSRKHAAGVAFLCAALPMLNWLSVVIIALVTLCKGAIEGLIVLLWSILALPVIFLYTGAWSWSLVVHVVLFGSLFVWGLAILWRRSASLVLVVELAVICGILAVLAVHGYADNIHAWWFNYITNNATKFIDTANVDFGADRIKQLAQVFAGYMTGLQSAVIVLSGFLQLLIARGMQAILYKPGSCMREWTQLRLSYLLVIALVVCFSLAWFGLGLFKDIMPVLLLPFLLAGISLVHSCLVEFRATKFVVLLFYLLLITLFIIQPLILSILVVLAAIDSFVNIRLRLLRYRKVNS